MMRGAAVSSLCGRVVRIFRTRLFGISKHRASRRLRMVVLLRKATPGPSPDKRNEAKMFILRQQAGQAGQAQQADQSGCSASTINRAKRALKAAATEQPRAGRGGSGALVVLLGVNGDKDTAVVAELRRFVRELLGCSVSFDTALVTVRLADGRLAVLHVAGAISSAGCWLYPAPLKPIAGAGRGGCYDSSAFLEVLAALRTAVAAGELPVPSSAADICTALVKALQGDDDEPAAAVGQERVGSDAAAIAAAAAAAATNTPHFRASQRGRAGAAALREQLLALQALAAPAPDSSPWILLQDCASQHTSAAAHLALQAGQHLVWQLDGALNPIEACWPLLKRCVASMTFADEAAAMQQLDLVWRGPEMRAAAAAAMSTGISHALQQ